MLPSRLHVPEDSEQVPDPIRPGIPWLDALFEQSPEAAAILTTGDQVIRVNREFTNLFGYRQEDIAGRPIHDVIVPERLAAEAREYARTIREGGRVEVETVRGRKDGSEVHVSVLTIPVTASGEHVANFALYRNITEQKRAEERLRESEARFQSMADTAPVLIWMTGIDGLCSYFNQPWLAFTGRTMEQEVGTGWTEGIHPHDLQGCLDGFLSAFHTRKPCSMEYRLRRSDGEYRWVMGSGIPRYTGEGGFAGYIGSNIDITDRKRAESLLAGEKRVLEMVAKGDSLREILDNLCRFVEQQASGVLVSVLLLDDSRLHHGGAPNLPREYVEAIDGAPIGPVAGSCGTAAYRGEQVIVEDIATDPLWATYRDLALPHGLRACWSTPVFSSHGQVIATFAMYYREPRRPSRHDQEIIEQTTHLAGVAIERKLAQDALRISESYLAEAQRLAHAGAWVWRIENREAVYLADEWYAIYGFNREEGPPNWEERLERIHPEDRAMWKGAIDHAISEKSDYEVEFRILLPTGAVKYLRTVGQPVFSESGELVKFVGISTDITERRRAEVERERLRELELDLAHINRVSMMGELAASLAHEVKQPITAAVINARACAQWLQREGPDLAEACEAASRMVTNATRAATILDRVRSLYWRDASEREPIDLNEVIREMIVLLRDKASRGFIAIRTELDPALPLTTADRVQMQQVLMNLLLNAIEAMKDGGGELTITSKRSENGQAQIAVSDQGVGLPAGDGERVFEAFFTTKPQGTGMGLSISRRIIESHGGRLWATANSGRGASFHFTLPGQRPAAAA